MLNDLESLLQQVKELYLLEEETLKLGNFSEKLGQKQFQGFLREFDDFFESQNLAL